MCWFESSPGHEGPSTKVEGFFNLVATRTCSRNGQMQKPQRRRCWGPSDTPLAGVAWISAWSAPIQSRALKISSKSLIIIFYSRSFWLADGTHSGTTTRNSLNTTHRQENATWKAALHILRNSHNSQSSTIATTAI
jgi:hypothetical protein